MASQTPPVYTVVLSDAGFAINRNGLPIKTPAGGNLSLPTQALAERIAAEWRAQGEKIIPSTMRMMQLAATAIDIVGRDREAVVEQVASYAAVDLLCVWAEAPDDLVIRQHKTWQPVLDWCAKRFGALLQKGQGVKAATQSPQAMLALRRAVKGFDNFGLTGLRQAAEVSGSLVLALALADGHLTAEQAFQAAELEALFQTEKWGDDPASAKRHESIRGDLAACEEWFRLLR